MNVFGKNERSWRKARKRGVSPIIATILLVAITVVLAAVLYVLISGLTGGGVGSKPIGTAFTVGPNPSTGATKCTAATGGCVAINDYIYTLTIESSSVNFGNVLFEVKNSVGSPLTVAATGQFTVLTTGAVIAASWTTTVAGTLAMPSSGFAFYGAAGVCGISGVACSAGSSLSNLYTIVVDVGTNNPAGQLETFTVLGTSGFTGTTGALTLS